MRITRWRSVQSAALYSDWADQRGLTGHEARVALTAAWKAGQSVEQYEAATDQLSNHGGEVEPVEYDIYADTIGFMADLSDPIARVTAGFVVAPKLRVVKDKQATIVATGSADPQTANLYRETIVPPEEAAIERGKELLGAFLEDEPAAIDTVEETAQEFLDIA